MSRGPMPKLVCWAFTSDADAEIAMTACRGVAEAILLCTCLRRELYVLGQFAPPRGQSIAEDEDAALRLFQIASGVLSVMPGEGAVSQQIRAALRAARRSHAIGARLAKLVKAALAAGEQLRARVREQCPIHELGDLVATTVAARGSEKGRIALFGAGHAAVEIGRALHARGLSVDVWATRTPRRAGQVGLPQGIAMLPEHDIVVTALGDAPNVINADHCRPGALLIDLGVPGNIAGPALTMHDLAALQREMLEPQQSAVERSAHRLPALAASAFAQMVSPEIAGVGASIQRFREAIVVAEFERLESLLASMEPTAAETVRRAIRHTAARCTHPLHEYVNQLGRQGRSGDAATMVDHLLGSRVGWTSPITEGAAPRAR